MFRSALFALSFAASGAVAQDLDLTPLIQSGGLAGAETELSGGDPASAFALGGVRFLTTIERALQLRYRHGAMFERLNMPVLRLSIPSNPNPEPSDPALVANLFGAVGEQMVGAREALAGANQDFGVTLDLSQIWFDVNANGAQDEGENIFSVAAALFGEPPIRPTPVVIRFDHADAAWLTAYTHMLEGFSSLVLAFDPTDVIAEIGASVLKMQEIRGTDDPRILFFSADDELMFDTVAMVYGAVNRQPDPAHTRATRQHWLAMVAENRVFWERLAQETDNDREWIPNQVQDAALGLNLPPETGETWLRVLSDAEAVLNGELLIGHWRVSPEAGVNVAKLMETPVPVDIVTWFHGHGLVDYIERGPLADTRNLRAFDRLFLGSGALFALFLN